MTGTKILLLGKNGQVGWELQRSLAPLGELIALDRHGDTERGLCGDLQDLNGLRETVRTLRPKVVVNAAAYTAVDKAESEPGLVQRLNAEAPEALAKAAEAIGAWLVQYSSDYVFDGCGGSPWVEDAPTGPLNAYGQAMRHGEQLIKKFCARHLILRTSWVYSANGDNFAKTILRLAQERGRLTVVDDQVGAPTGAELVADVTAHAIRQALGRPEIAGTYHLAASGETSWYRYACFVIETAHSLKPQLELAVRELVPVSSNDFATIAKRPHNSRLDTTRLRSTFDLYLPPWQSGVTRMLTEIL